MAFATVILVALFIVSIYRIIRDFPLSRRKRILLLVLRSVFVLLLVIAFIEPVFVFDRFSAPQQQVPVLVDVSKSMRPYVTYPAVVQAFSSFKQWNADPTDKKKQFVFYCFGDSLRHFNKTSSLDWSDHRSYFPNSISDKTLRRAASMVLISDGNWSNATIPIEFFYNKNVTYIPLYGTRHYPYLRVELQDFSNAAPVDSPFVSVVGIEGFLERNDTITVNVVEKNNPLLKRVLPVSSGFIKQKVTFHLTCHSAGSHLYRFDAHSTIDTLFCSCYALHSALPGRFTFALCDVRPTLDCRFIRLSLLHHSNFTESVTSNGQNLDLLVIFDWDEKAQNDIKRLKPGGVALFIGCLPCDQTLFLNSAAVKLMRLPSGSSANPFNNFDDLDINRLPPPSRYILCKEPSFRPGNIFLSALSHSTDRSSADTFDILFTGRYQSHNFIACAASDLWRWDFWPIGIESAEERAFGYSDRLIALTKEMLDNGLSEKLILFPAAALSEFDSLPFWIILPADLPLFSKVHLSISFMGTGIQRNDTAFTLTATGDLHQLMRFKPLPAGHYRIDASASLNNRNYFFSDSLYIDQDRSEYSALSQNVTLLQELAQPLTDFSEQSLRTFFSGSDPKTKQTARETVQIVRSWPLLLMLLLTFAAEWVMRRVIKLDY